MAEKILVKTVGGPADNDTRVIDRGEVGWAWPPPLNFRIPGYNGVYVRETFSSLPELDEGSHIMRGAQYQWVED
jgi:hypothetical protein